MNETVDTSTMSNGAALCFFAAGVLLALSLPVVLTVGKSTAENKPEKTD
jgi:hypothetical protein